MKKIVIFGSGSQAKVIFQEIVKEKKFQLLGFIDEEKKIGNIVTTYKKKNYRIIGSISSVIKKKNRFSGIIGIGLNSLRKKVHNKIRKIDKNFKFEKLISKDAIVNYNVSIGEGSVIISGSVININTVIGKHCIVNTSSSIDHDNVLDDFSSIGPGVITGGYVKIKSKSHIGIGSVIKNHIVIEESVVVGSNSFVNKNCKKNQIYFGSPARKIRKIKKNENYLV